MVNHEGAFVKISCPATGKTCFDTKDHAEESISRFRYFTQHKVGGKRIKHRQGKPDLKRVYTCEHCGYHHFTSWETEAQPNTVNKKSLTPNTLKRFKY